MPLPARFPKNRPATEVSTNWVLGWAWGAAVAALVIAVPASADILRVPDDHATIQGALNAATFGDVVIVSAGTYPERLALGSLQDGVHLKSASGPEATEIRGDGLGSVIECSNVGASTVIEGFTITSGGGFSLGGGIRLTSADPVITGNILRDNHAAAGGAMYVDRSSPHIVGNTIRDNSADFGSGGGIYCDHFANPHIERNIIVQNYSDAFGGAVTIWEGSSPYLEGNTIALNRSLLSGGGIYVTRNSHPRATNNIVAFNSQGGGVVRADQESTFDLACNDVYGNTPADYSGLAPATGIAGNISADPVFCEMNVLDFGLAAMSPCTNGHSPSGCGWIGALGIVCAPTPVHATTWGRLKATYR